LPPWLLKLGWRVYVQDYSAADIRGLCSLSTAEGVESWIHPALTGYLNRVGARLLALPIQVRQCLMSNNGYVKYLR
jgi:hypothetical protein